MTALSLRRILAGVAPSGVSDEALHAAARLAQTFDAKLDLVHAVPIPQVSWIGIGREQLARLHTDAVGAALTRERRRLRTLEAARGLPDGSLTRHLKALAGAPDQVLLERAEATSADLVVLGSHGHHKVFDFGRTARGLLPRLETALWLQTGPWRELQEVVVPVDFSPHARAALGTAAALAGALGAQLRIVHVFEQDWLGYPEEIARDLVWPKRAEEEYRQDLEQAQAALVAETDLGGVPCETQMVDAESPVEGILALSGPGKLVVLGTRGHTSPLLGRVTYGVLRRIEGAALALHGGVLG